MERVLVVGATGTTGKKIVDILDEYRNYIPVAMIRRKERATQFEERNINTVLADLEKNVSHTVTGIEKVIFAAGSGGDTSKEKTLSVDQEGAIKLIDMAQVAGIKKFVMLSAMGADEPESNQDIKHYLEAKHNADEHLKASGMPYTIVRPGALTNDKGTDEIEASKKLGKSGEISREDVANTLVAVLNDTTAQNKTFEILTGDTAIEEAVQEI